MPNRIIKESVCTSDTLASVSPEAERLFWRLVVQADDFGLYDARPNIVLGKCLTAMMDQVTASDVEAWLVELEDSGLIYRYESDGKPYLKLTTWEMHQRTRAKNPKFPHPPADDSKRNQMKSLDSKRGQVPADGNNGQRDEKQTFSGEKSSDSGCQQMLSNDSPNGNVNEFGNENGNVNVNDPREGDDENFVLVFNRTFDEHQLTPFDADVLEPFAESMTEAVVCEAIHLAEKQKPLKQPLKYVERILMNWQDKGVKTLADARRIEEEFQKSVKPRNKSDPKDENPWANLDEGRAIV